MFVNKIRFSTCTASWCFVRWPFWITWTSFWRNYFTWKRLCLYITTIQRMYCLLVFRKMPFTIHFIFTPLTDKIFWPLFTTFCSCFLEAKAPLTLAQVTVSEPKKVSNWNNSRCLIKSFKLCLEWLENFQKGTGNSVEWIREDLKSFGRFWNFSGRFSKIY